MSGRMLTSSGCCVTGMLGNYFPSYRLCEQFVGLRAIIQLTKHMLKTAGRLLWCAFDGHCHILTLLTMKDCATDITMMGKRGGNLCNPTLPSFRRNPANWLDPYERNGDSESLSLFEALKFSRTLPWPEDWKPCAARLQLEMTFRTSNTNTPNSTETSLLSFRPH